MARVNAGAMSKSEFDAKWKKPVNKNLAGPGGLYKNLVKKEEYGAGEEGSDEVAKKYKDETPGQSTNEEVLEACWDSHKQVGFKMKDGRRVPNCVPKEGADEEEDQSLSPLRTINLRDLWGGTNE